MFLPLYQQTYAAVAVVVSAESSGALQSVTEGTRSEITKLDARMPVYGVMTAEENMTIAYWGPRLAAGMASTFGVLTLVLATMGLYSVMTYAVSQRTREIGIRVALGAQVRDVLRLILSQGMRMTLIGIALGLTGAFSLTRVLASLLLGVGTTDLITFAGVPCLLIAIALLACYIPARRAARVDPLIALRQD
jgi:ABC-type antimicrobial peptide transport system permease subunit